MSKYSHLTKIDQSYMELVDKIITTGEHCKNRTGIDTIALSGHMFEHNMSEGFPAITVKKLFFTTMSIELEGFLKGITDKAWYKNKKCYIWNGWCKPSLFEAALEEKVMSGEINNSMTVEERRDAYSKIRHSIDDLGAIYGAQWNNFNGVNQLDNIIHKLQTDPDDRRMIVSAWNPPEIGEMALPPCHVLWQINKIGDKLDLIWYQRSVDVPLGLPFNIASYGLLLELICKQTGYKAGKLIGMLSNVHIYENQIEGIIEKLIPQALKSTIEHLPTLVIKDTFTTIKEFDALQDVVLENYESEDFVKLPIAE